MLLTLLDDQIATLNYIFAQNDMFFFRCMKCLVKKMVNFCMVLGKRYIQGGFKMFPALYKLGFQITEVAQNQHFGLYIPKCCKLFGFYITNGIFKTSGQDLNAFLQFLQRSNFISQDTVQIAESGQMVFLGGK